MAVITDSTASPSLRSKALQQLARLRNRGVTEKLISLYPEADDREVKRQVIACLISSEDPRAFSLFLRILETEQDPILNLSAATALARWNVRRGVAELVRVFEECEGVEESGRSLCDLAAISFQQLDMQKGWGFPRKQIEDQLSERQNLNVSELRRMYASELTKWYAENEHRFPEWSVGDPLPEAPEFPPVPPGPTDALELSAEFRTDRITIGSDAGRSIDGSGKRGAPQAGDADVRALARRVAAADGTGDWFRSVRQLRQIGDQLKGTEEVPELMRGFRSATKPYVREEILFCLADSKDQRTIPVFVDALDSARESSARLAAAYGLATWNIRRGVDVLIALVGPAGQGASTEEYPLRTRSDAARLFLRLNHHKSWWAPKSALESVSGTSADSKEEALNECHQQLLRWFDENKERFPEWNEGDPLPESE